MTDYRVSVKITNARIQRALEAQGFSSLKNFFNTISVPLTSGYDLVNLKRSPMTKEGKWRKPALKIAEGLKVLPEDIWPEHMRIVTVWKNRAYRDVTYSEARRLAEQRFSKDYYLDPPPDPERLLLQDDRKKKVEDLLETLTPRERAVIRCRWGIGCKVTTQSDLASRFDVSVGRIAQIEAKALRKLKSKTLLDYKAGSGGLRKSAINDGWIDDDWCG